MTWNLWWRFGPWEQRQPAIVSELRDVDADVVLLQEVYAVPATDSSTQFDEVEDQAVRLADLLGFELARTVDSEGGAHRFGNAILSRWPIRSSETVQLPNPDGLPGHRSALLAEIDTPRGLQLVVCTHLEWRYDQSATRSRQLALICDRVKQWVDRQSEAADKSKPALPPILGGDLNAVPDSDEIRRLTGLAPPHVDGLIFTDAWAATNHELGHTWTRMNSNSPDAQWPNRRLDYLLVAWPRQRPQMNPLTTRLGGVLVHDGVVPSDHYSVIATLDDRPPVTPVNAQAQTAMKNE